MLLMRHNNMTVLQKKKLYNTMKTNLQFLKSTGYKWNENRRTHTTVDASDVERHTKLMDEWWNPDGALKALHSMNSLRVPFVRDGLVQWSPDKRSCTPLKNKKILDVGCGGGILAESLARLGASVTGVDASKQLINLAEEHASKNPRLHNNKPEYICTSVEEHAAERNSYYDGVVASEIIEHINNNGKDLFVKSCVQALKPAGRIFFTTPNKTRISQITGIYMAECLNIVPKGTHQYDKFMTPNELIFLLERSPLSTFVMGSVKRILQNKDAKNKSWEEVGEAIFGQNYVKKDKDGCYVESVFGMFYNVLTNTWSWIGPQVFMFALQAVKST